MLVWILHTSTCLPNIICIQTPNFIEAKATQICFLTPNLSNAFASSRDMSHQVYESLCGYFCKNGWEKHEAEAYTMNLVLPAMKNRVDGLSTLIHTTKCKIKVKLIFIVYFPE